LAVLKIVWRCTSTATWVSFKVWGIIPLIFLFAWHRPLVIKHQTRGGENTQDCCAGGIMPRGLSS
jgi:intracellular septation protein